MIIHCEWYIDGIQRSFRNELFLFEREYIHLTLNRFEMVYVVKIFNSSTRFSIPIENKNFQISVSDLKLKNSQTMCTRSKKAFG